MTDLIDSRTIEEKIRAALSTSEPDPLFVETLEKRLIAGSGLSITSRKSLLTLKRSLVYAGLLLLAALCALIISLGPKNVYAAVLDFFGFLPGVGFVSEDSTIRVLEAAASQTRDGISLTIDECFATDEKTTLSFIVENVPYSSLSHDENIGGCGESAYLLLPDGTSMNIIGGGGTQNRTDYIYPPIPADVHEIHFVLPCIQGTLPGKAPENWEIVFHLIPAPLDLTVFPVIDLPTSTPAALQGSQTPLNSSDPYGLEIALEQVIPLSDGYYLIGYTTWATPLISSAYPGYWSMKAFDANGQEIPFEPVNSGNIGLDDLQPNHWVYRLYGTTFAGPLTLRSDHMGVEFSQPVKIQLDPASYGFTGSDEELGVTQQIDPVHLDILNLNARIVKITYMQQGVLQGFEIGIEAESGLQTLPLTLDSAVTGGQGASGGGSNRDSASNLVLSYVLSDGQMSYPLLLSASSATLNGVWETSWDPPAAGSYVEATPMPEACLTKDDWMQALENATQLPDEIQGRLLLSRGALAPDPSLFISDVDGSTEQGLVFGNGSLSADGARLVYSDMSSNIAVLDLARMQISTLTNSRNDFNPIWSPDGNRIAFMRYGEGTQIFIMDSDGTNIQPVISISYTSQLAGWSPDSEQILYSTSSMDGNWTVRLVSIATGDETDLFEANLDSPAPVFSPDGEWIAFLDRVPGKMANGLYLIHPDGSGKKLVVQADYWPVGGVNWSPDGNWLIFSIINTDAFTANSINGLLNLATCDVIPLLNLDGVVQDWVNP